MLCLIFSIFLLSFGRFCFEVSIFEACAETKGKIHLPSFLKLLHGDRRRHERGKKRKLWRNEKKMLKYIDLNYSHILFIFLIKNFFNIADIFLKLRIPSSLIYSNLFLLRTSSLIQRFQLAGDVADEAFLGGTGLCRGRRRTPRGNGTATQKG